MIVKSLAAAVGRRHREYRTLEVRAAASLLSCLGHDRLKARRRSSSRGKIFTDDEIRSERVQGFLRRRAGMREGEHVGLERTEHRDQQLGRIVQRDGDASAALDATSQRLAEDARFLGE